MALNAAFFPRGPLYTVSTTANGNNCPTTDGSGQAPSYRIKCIAASRAYITWGTASGITAAGAPSVGTPSANTLGMEPGGVEVINGAGPWFISSVANGFEVLPGEGE